MSSRRGRHKAALCVSRFKQLGKQIDYHAAEYNIQGESDVQVHVAWVAA